MTPIMEAAVRERCQRTGLDGHAAKAEIEWEIRQAWLGVREVFLKTAKTMAEAYIPAFRNMANIFTQLSLHIPPPRIPPLPIDGHAYHRRARNRRKR